VDAVSFTGTQGSLSAIGVWCAFGLAVAGKVMTSLWGPAAISVALFAVIASRFA
jgi:integral membrane sensor domain MASE1